MKNWTKSKVRKVLAMGHDLWYVNRIGIHTYSPSSCGHGDYHAGHYMTQGGNRCTDCLMNDMQEFFRDKRLKQNETQKTKRAVPRR